MSDTNKILDCSNLPTEVVDKIKLGFELFKNDGMIGNKSFFGRIAKSDMKFLTREFKYTDKKTLIKGGIIGAGAVWIGSKIKNNFDDYKKKVIQTFGPKLEEEETDGEES